MFMLCKYFLFISVTVISLLTILVEKDWGKKVLNVCIYLELLCFVKYDIPTEYLTLISWFAVLVNECFDSRVRKMHNLDNVYICGSLYYEQIIDMIKVGVIRQQFPCVSNF